MIDVMLLGAGCLLYRVYTYISASDMRCMQCAVRASIMIVVVVECSSSVVVVACTHAVHV